MPMDRDDDISDEESDFLDIPMLDAVPLRILKVLAEGEFDMRRFADAVEADPAIGEQLIKLASSPLYGASQKFENVQKAVVYLGLRTALSIGLGFSMFQSMRKSGGGTKEEQWCWRRMVVNGVAAREAAKITHACPTEAAFLNGICQDMGLLLLVQQRPKQYIPILQKFRNDPEPFADIEMRELGYTHAIVSEALLSGWQFPTEGINAIGAHHDDPPPGKVSVAPVDVLTLAETMTDFLLMPAPKTLRHYEATYAKMGLNSEVDSTEFAKTVFAGALSLADILSISFAERLPVEEKIAHVHAAEAAEEERLRKEAARSGFRPSAAPEGEQSPSSTDEAT